MNETVWMYGENPSLVGVMTQGSSHETRTDLPVLLYLSGQGIHRVGPNRLFVRMARHIVCNGFRSFRFDFSGVGDSSYTGDDDPCFLNRVVNDTIRTMDFLSQQWGIRKFILIGLCWGGGISFEVSGRDHRVVGALLLNPPIELFNDSRTFREYMIDRRRVRRYRRLAVINPFEFANSIYRHKNKIGGHFRGMFTRLFWYIKNNGTLKSSCNSSSVSVKKNPRTNELLSDLEKIIKNKSLLWIFTQGELAHDYLKRFGQNILDVAGKGDFELETIKEANHTFDFIDHQNILFKIIEEWLARRWSKRKKNIR